MAEKHKTKQIDEDELFELIRSKPGKKSSYDIKVWTDTKKPFVPITAAIEHMKSVSRSVLAFQTFIRFLSRTFIYNHGNFVNKLLFWQVEKEAVIEAKQVKAEKIKTEKVVKEESTSSKPVKTTEQGRSVIKKTEPMVKTEPVIPKKEPVNASKGGFYDRVI